MKLTDFSLWALLTPVLLAGAVIVLFFFIDRKSMKQFLRVASYALLSMALIAAYMWGLAELNSWKSTLFCGLFFSVGVSLLVLKNSKERNKRLFLPVALAVTIGFFATIGITQLLFTPNSPLVFPAMMGVLAAFMLPAVSAGLKTYIHSLRHTKSHYQYLLTNGANHFEAIMPCVKRALSATLLSILDRWASPLVFVLPMLLCGLLMAGVQPVTATLLVVILMVVALFSTMLTMCLVLLLADRLFFDRSGQILL